MLKDYKICYHGTIKKHGEYIEGKGIDLSKGRFATDFGKGFYITSNLSQAEKWARNKCRDNIDNFKLEDIKPVIVYFTLDVNKVSTLDGLIFDEPNLDWANFVLESRKKGRQNELSHEHDFVLGPLADGKLAALLRRVISGKMSIKEFLDDIKPLSPESTQLSLNTEKSLAYIKYWGVKEIEL